MRKEAPAKRRKRRSGIPTGNAGEYFVMGELLRRGYDAQLADRNTRDYDVLVGRPGEPMRRVQVKTVRQNPWYVSVAHFTEPELVDQVTIYVQIGKEDCRHPVRYFITRNREVAAVVSQPPHWDGRTGFVKLADVQQFEDRWELLA